VCHQSVGLIARQLESVGIPTVAMTSAWSITAAVNTPRAAFLDFPLGHTSGPPERPDDQRAIVRDALGLFESVEESGTIVTLGQRWGAPWKHDRATMAGNASARVDSPQYQNDSDRQAAVDRHGGATACVACDPTVGSHE
jgi:hypothetical protein